MNFIKGGFRLDVWHSVVRREDFITISISNRATGEIVAENMIRRGHVTPQSIAGMVPNALWRNADVSDIVLYARTLA